MRPDLTATVTDLPSFTVSTSMRSKHRAASPERARLLRRLTRDLPAAVVAVAGLALVGCASPQPVDTTPQGSRLIEPNSFQVAWRVNLDTSRHGDIDQVFLRDDSVFVYTDKKVVQRVSAGGGRTQFITPVVRPNDVLYPPVIVPAKGRAVRLSASWSSRRPAASSTLTTTAARSARRRWPAA